MTKKHYFPYKREPSKIFGEISRPVVEAYLETRDGDWFQVSPYADSGADVTLFPRSICEILGLKLKEGEKSSITGVSGEEIKIFIHKIKIRIGDEGLEIPAAFAEREDIPYLLGRAGILDYFDIWFEKDRVCFIVRN
ncbi:MAG: hypothetical protein QMC85_05850 [Methanocellales archaeon]|nr:hypothetical protein [Methanocellales archaeon]MDI6902166.1 hypothetical protein [Methanocellales archaeon]